jgi:hypothetical protein
MHDPVHVIAGLAIVLFIAWIMFGRNRNDEGRGSSSYTQYRPPAEITPTRAIRPSDDRLVELVTDRLLELARGNNSPTISSIGYDYRVDLAPNSRSIQCVRLRVGSEDPSPLAEKIQQAVADYTTVTTVLDDNSNAIFVQPDIAFCDWFYGQLETAASAVEPPQERFKSDTNRHVQLIVAPDADSGQWVILVQADHLQGNFVRQLILATAQRRWKAARYADDPVRQDAANGFDKLTLDLDG